MPKPKVLALVMAGGEGSRLGLLTERRAKPALPFAGGGELKDFGHGLLPRLVEAGEAVEHRMAGYWRDVGTVPAYWQAHMDLLDPERPLDLDDPAWPVLGRAPPRLPARDRDVRVDPGAVVGALGGDGPALVGEAARVPEDSHVPPGGRFGADSPEEATP